MKRQVLNALGSISLMVVALVGTSGCSLGGPGYSGFLEDYSGLEPGGEGEMDFIYRKEGLDLGAYDKVMIDRIVIWYSPESEYKGIHPRELQAVVSHFESSLLRALGDDYPVVEEPGPGVLRVRAAITGVTASKPLIDHYTAIGPISRTLSEAKEAVTGTHMFVGTARMEAELLDSETHERLAAVVDRYSGKKTLIKYTNSWEDAAQAVEFWAYRLRQALDMGHANR